MTTADVDLTLNAPADPSSEPVFDHNGVRRSKDGRPYVKVRCPNSAVELEFGCIGGRIPGKRPGTSKKCPKCDGVTGWKEVLYTRCTSFVGALEDRQNLEAWMKRTVLVGLAADVIDADPWSPQLDTLLYRIRQVDPDDRAALDLLADEAFEAGDGYLKAQKGTDLHALTERVDRGEPLGDVSDEDRADMAAWKRTLEEYGIEVLDIEKFVVEDGYRIGGTYDRRIYSYDERLQCEACGDFDDVGVTMPKILDLKTGRVDYGGGKMRQQLAVYANSVGYDPKTGERSEHDVCPHLGFILHLGQGTGEAHLYSVDLVKGWADVALSDKVRQHRRESKNALTLLGSNLLLDYTKNPSNEGDETS